MIATHWHYKGMPFDMSYEDLTQQWVGFVYVITEQSTGMMYVGKKLFHNKKILPVTKSRKRRKHTLVESNWRDYYGSSPNLKEQIDTHGPENYHREILHLCTSKGWCSYLEAKEQFDRDVLTDDRYYNGIISCRINGKHLK